MPNRYQKYLRDRAEFVQERAERENRSVAVRESVKTLATIGGVVAGVALYKKGVFDDLIGKGLREIGAGGLVEKGRRLSILNDVYKNSVSKLSNGKFSKFINPDVSKFKSIVSEQLDNAADKLRNPLAGRRSVLQKDVDELYMQLEEGARGHIKKATLSNFQQRIDNDATITDGVRGTLKDILGRMKVKTNFLSESSVEQLSTALNATKDQHNFQGDVLEMAKKIQGHVDAAKAAFQDAAPADVTKLKEQGLKLIQERYGAGREQNTFFGGLLGKAGYQRATVGDLTRINGGDINSLGNNFGTFAEDMRKLGFNANALHLQDDIFVNGAGDLLDASYLTKKSRDFFNYLSMNFQIPFVNLNPLRLTQGVMRNAMKEADHFATFAEGQLSPGASVTNAFQEDVFYMFGKIFNLEGQQMYGGKEFVLAPAEHGAWQRMLGDWMGIGQKTSDSFIQNALDIGLQRNQSALGRKMSAFTKGQDETWAPNILNRIMAAGGGTKAKLDDLESLYRQATSQLYRNTDSLDHDTASVIYDMFARSDHRMILENLGITKNDFLMDTPEEIMGTLRKLVGSNQYSTMAGADVQRPLFAQMQRELKAYDKHPERFMDTFFSMSDPEFPLPGILETLSPNKTDILPRTEQVKRLIQQDVLQYVFNAGALPADFAQTFSPKAAKTVKEMLVLNKLMTNIDEVKMARSATGEFSKMKIKRQELLESFGDEIVNGDGVYAYMPNIIKERFPWWGYGPGKEVDKPFAGQRYIPIAKASSFYKKGLTDINEQATAGNIGGVLQGAGNVAVDFLQSMFAGRNTMDKLSTASFVPYYAVHRLNDAISTLGIGLSGKSMGSAAGIFGNLLLKRFGAVLLGMNMLAYLGYETEQLTGKDPNDVLADTYANMTLDAARLRDAIGITRFNRMTKGLFPGSEHLYENPLGGAVKFLTAGMIGDTRSEEELMQYYKTGSDPIRNGRWWGWGSNTPWYGGQIMYYEPNFYRKMKSDYQYTDVMYGSKDEYWAHNILPTPQHPFSTVSAILDPNYWQRKHREDRPYPIEGGSPIEELPIVGPLWQSTVGKVLTPTWRRRDLRQQEQRYLADYNEEIKSQYQNSGNALYVTGSGQGKIVNMQPSDGFGPGGSGSEPVEIIGGGYGGTGSGAAGGGSTYSRSVGRRPVRGSVAYKGDLAEINRAYTDRSSLGPTQYTNLDKLRDINARADLRSAVDPSSIGANVRDIYYSMTEIAGIYGFATNLVFGQDYQKQTRLAEATAITSLNRAFWDLNLGGLGGELSEIGRRFIPRDVYKDKYNPIRNTMPEWLPFEFRYGDPFTRVPHGEFRLPGGGYESMNRLHPDMFGKYGAVDRFKILADIAPFSNQYSYYNKVMSVYNSNDLLSEEENTMVQEMRKQVSSRKLKYEFQPYKFKYADLIKKRVRITGMIDPTTFMVEGYSQPIRLAGIEMPAQDDMSAGAQEARQYLTENIASGKDIVIGINADPLSRIKGDTLGTMRAVAYTFTGENINKHLANIDGENGKGAVKVNYDDQTAAGVHAVYGDSVVLGGLWEAITHLDNPISTKFLQNQSPLESYKRRHIYGKDFRTWDDPWRGYVVPLVESMGQANPIIATTVGAFVGSLFGTKGRTGGRKIAAAIGAVVAGGASVARTLRDSGELVGGDTWIPERRQKQREIEEYFDILKYIKYKRLYDKARNMAIFEEGVDIEQIVKEGQEGKGLIAKLRKRKLEQRKKFLKLEMMNAKSDHESIKLALKQINQELESIASNREAYQLGPLSQLAMKYKGQMDGTIYGADTNASIQTMFSALPKNDREYMAEFLTASPKEREEILRLIPKNERRFFQAKWGLPVTDTRESLPSYFLKHYLPGPSWEGWKPDVPLENIKIKTLRQEGLDASDFGFYKTDVSQAAGYPSIPNMNRANIGGALESLIPEILRNILSGAGVRDIDIKAQTLPAYVRGGYDADVTMNLTNDNTDQHKDNLNNYRMSR